MNMENVDKIENMDTMKIMNKMENCSDGQFSKQWTNWMM